MAAIRMFSLKKSHPQADLRYPKIAVIGTRLTVVAAAAQCVWVHDFDVTGFEAQGRDKLGGIWSHVSIISGLHIHSLMYRFHPAIKYSGGYSKSNEIV